MNVGSPSSSTLSPLVPEIVALLGGVISAVIIALPLNTFFDFVKAETIFIAPLVEEPAKASGLILLALSYPEVLKSKARGLLLGGLAGLGFAFTENLFYATMSGTNVVARAILPVPMHIMASGVAGLGVVYLAQDRVESRKNRPGVSMSILRPREIGSLLAVAVVLHGEYNFLSFFGYAGSLFGLAIIGFIYYRLGTSLPENLQFFTIPGPVGLLTSTVQHMPKKRIRLPPPKVVSSTIVQPHRDLLYCISCGQSIPNGAGFCDRCGESQR